jgi:hypothetical protein
MPHLRVRSTLVTYPYLLEMFSAKYAGRGTMRAVSHEMTGTGLATDSRKPKINGREEGTLSRSIYSVFMSGLGIVGALVTQLREDNYYSVLVLPGTGTSSGAHHSSKRNTILSSLVTDSYPVFVRRQRDV